MRHRRSGKKLGRDRKARNGLLRSLVAAFVRNGRITTTFQKAKVTQQLLEKLVRKIKKDGSSSQHFLFESSQDKLLTKMFIDRARHAEYSSGQTRIERVGLRRGDGALVARLVWAHGEPQAQKSARTTTRRREQTVQKIENQVS